MFFLKNKQSLCIQSTVVLLEVNIVSVGYRRIMGSGHSPQNDFTCVLE